MTVAELHEPEGPAIGASRAHAVSEAALGRFRAAISADGRAGTLLDADEAARFARDTLATGDTGLPVVVSLADAGEIRRALAQARAEGLSVHPVSTGRNWGYGTARPAGAGTQLIFDLSAMTKILGFDRELGVVTIEPGVTQGQLAAFLADERAELMVPTTGAGPSCSLVGNALERGYGMTPIADHFQAVLGLAAILGDGSLYRSPLSQAPGQRAVPIAAPYRWGVGPYLDGLFAQSGGAIVTEMTLQLAPRPDRVEMFVFWITDETRLEAAVEAIRHLLTRAGVTLGGINLMNAARIRAMAGARATGSAAWIGTGVMYGDRRVVRAARAVITGALRSIAQRTTFVNAERLAWLERAVAFPGMRRRIGRTVDALTAAYRMLAGFPSEFALALAYAASPDAMPASGRNPAEDGCGLLWYAPLVPMRGEAARRFSRMVSEVCAANGFTPPITFSTLSASTFDATVPLMFPRDARNSARALACLRALIAAGRAQGFQPYRYHSALMAEATAGADDFWRLAERIRAAIDPDGTISPGRYRRPSGSDAPRDTLDDQLTTLRP